jgi:hypothetical protein
MSSVTRLASSAGHGFRFVIWAVIIASIAMIIAGGIDLLLELKWGFSAKDVFMAVIVLLIAIVVKIVGSKIIATFGKV